MNDDPSALKHSKYTYILKDKSGEFVYDRESGPNKKEKLLISKSTIYRVGESDKPLEKVVSASTPGQLGKVKILRPKFSEYTVYFDKKKYVSTIRLDPKKKRFFLKLDSPEQQWQGEREILITDSKGVYCFYEQLIECAQITGFIKMAQEKGAGEMNLYLVWNGYPYFQEQYSDLEDSLFVPATFEFDGKNQAGEVRFSLKTPNQIQFYFLDKKMRLIKHFWVSQGLSKTLQEGFNESN